MNRYCSKCESRITDLSRTGICDACRKKERNTKFYQENKYKIQEYQIKCRDLVETPGGIQYRKLHNIPLDLPRKKNRNGQGCIDVTGYKTISVKGHPNAMDERGRIREHVYVMSEHLKRPLVKGETVHHKNGDKLDNRIENLELWDRSQTSGQRVEDKIKWCLDFLSRHGYSLPLKNK